MIPIIEIVKIKNPFNLTCRESEQAIFVPGKRLTEYIDEPDIDYILNSNFVEQPELTYPSDGDQIVIMPHVGSGLKKILGMIAMIVLSVYTSNISGGLWTAGKVGLTSYLAAGAVMVIGGKLINTMFGTKANSLSSEGSSQTYGWNTPSPLSGEGNIIGVTYGECIPAPQIIETHIDTVNDKQYLNVLLCGGMGPIDEITDIQIGGNPIANYTDVSYEIRYGTNDQEVIPNFGDTTNNQELSYELSESTWATQLIDGSNAEGLQITLEFPNGLYHLNKKGKLESASVTLAVEYRLQGDTAWTNWFGSGSHIASTSIAGATCYPTAPIETWTISVMNFGTGTNTVIVKGSVSGVQLPTTGGAIVDNGRIKFTAPNKRGTYKIVVANNSIISASQNTAVRRSFKIDNLTAGKYEVRAKITARSAATTSTMDCTTCYWTQLTSIIYDDFSRPNKVLVGVRILATSQLSSGMPDFTWRQKRNTVYVWNPETSAYETRAANNPIWAAYDIYHQCRYLKNINTGLYEYTVFGVAHTRLDPYWGEWVECAAYADELVLGTDGTTYEKRFEFDAFFDTAQKRYDAAQQAANVGHATIMPRGNNIGIVCDKPGTMTQVFGEGRTTMSSLQGTFSGIDDRATAVEVVFSDTDNDFVNTQFMVRSSKWASQMAAQDNPAQLQLFGVKRKSQAYREGVYTLANNLLITQFVDIGTDIDAMVCQYGDIVGLNHTVSQMGIASGRIVAADTSTVTLDKTVTLTAGQSYQIIITLSVSDVIVKRSTVPVSADTETNVLTVTQPFAVIPAQYDNYMFGEADKAVKPFRVVGIEKSGDLTCKLSLAEYCEGVYTGDLNYPIIDYTPPIIEIPEVINLQAAEESYITTDGVTVSQLSATWNLDRDAKIDNFLVYYSVDNANWKYLKTTADMVATIENVVVGTTYYVKVKTVRGVAISSGVVSAPLIILGNMLTPEIPSNMSVTFTDKGYWVWDTQEPNIDYWELRADINVGNTVGLYIKTSTNTATFTPATRSGQVFLYAHNKNNIYSEPLIYNYSKPAPFAPTNIEIKDIFQGIVITCDTIPNYCLGVNFHINDGTGDKIYFSANNSYTYKTTGGIFDIQIAYVDIFGEGEKSATIQKIVKATIDPALLEAESISLEKMDTVIKNAIAKANVSVDTTTLNTAIDGINTDIININTNIAGINTDITTINTNISNVTNTTIPNLQIDLQGKIDTINTSMTALDNAKVSHTEFTTTQNTLVQADADNRSLITQNASSITSMVGKLNSAPDAVGQYTSISTLKQTADSISLTVANKANISDLTITNNSITNMVAKLNSAPNAVGQYTSISTLKQTADTISATVSANKTDADGKITTANSNITQNANAISTTVAELNKDPFGTTPPTYTAFTKIKQTTDTISATVATKANVSDLTITNNNITAMVAKLNSTPNSTGQYTAISTLKQTADTISATVTANKTDADNKITTANSNITQTANSLTTTIAELNKDPYGTTPPTYTAFSKIKQTTDAINTTVATKANVADLTVTNNNITATVAKLNSAPDAVGQYSAISQLKQTADAISSTVSNISIGGSNLFRTSGNFGSTITNWFDNSGGLVVDTVEKYRGFNTIKTTVGGGIVGNWYKLENNVEYTYSIMLKSSVAFTGSTITPTHFWAGLNNVSQSKCSVLKHNTSYTTADVGKYKLLSVTFKLTSDADSFKPYVYFGTTQTCVFNIAYLKLEKGNIATDWTPAPEDIDYSISQITQTTDSITSIVTANKTAQDGVNTTTTTAIAQANADIQLRATKANLISQINICPETISLKSKLVHIAGDTVIDDNVIVGKMISAGSITANKMATGSITISNFDTNTAGLITTAQTTANTAVTNAATAQSTANTAVTNAATAQSTADVAKANALTAQNTANTAVTNAGTANALLADIASDAKLTANEKVTIKQTWDSIVSEYTLNLAQATTFGITTTKTAYTTAYTALNTYITPLLTSLTTTSTIVRATFNSNFKAYYDARTNLLNAIALNAKTLANTAQATADTKTTQLAVYNSYIDQVNPLVFNHVTNVTVSGNDISKTAGTASTWDASCSATRLLYNGNYAEYTVAILGRNIMFGLSSSWVNASYTSIDYAIYQTGSSLNVYEDGLSKLTTLVPTVLGDKLRVAVENNQVKYYKNGVLFYTSLKTPTLPMVLDTSFYVVGDKINDVTIGTTILADMAKLTATAQTTANTANSLLADLADDNKLTSLEKHTVQKEWDAIKSEYSLNLTLGTAMAVSTTAYTTAYNALNTYITPLLASLTTTSAIVGTTFRSTFKSYYDAKVNLLNSISTATEATANQAVTNASIAQTTANNAVTAAATAQTQANLGVTNAATANALLADMSNDSKLTPIEKQSLQQTWSIIGSEYTLNLAQATAMGITTTKTAYTTAYTALNTYVPPLLTSLTTTSAIVGTTYRANFKAYYDARTNLLNAIATATEATANTAVTNASTAQTTANTANTNATTANNQLTAWKKTGTTQINGGVIATNSVTADKLQIGSTSGARTEIVNNLIRVYDANNVLRVRLGVW
ncbi:hypothetical protein SOV_50790 [Sporomusa ovata DSM 2662]|uniref:Phage tail fiber protein n=1 Tax=Sporomusa ovata TaxID=2378 RepID=A0A0U1L0U8_9FIRM|nr:hypothetical protein SOV_2c03480 [Sporomusa ovata DSM 2662]CQR73296.1 Phage tail fiber protein [Sporomusa ovata]